MSSAITAEAALVNLLNTYNDLNPASLDILDEEPSALEFMRYVARNRPFVIRKGAEDWKACQRWDAEYLVQVMGNSNVNVALTPHGNADAVVEEERELLYVEPMERQEPFEQVIDYIRRQEKGICDGPVKYAQTQNDNLRDEYQDLFADVPSSISFARIALQKPPEAVNFWLGNHRSVTVMHKDNYENIYVQIRGQKHFLLLPPIAAACVQERSLPLARYSGGDEALHPKLQEPPQCVPVPLLDPDDKNHMSGILTSLLKPMSVTLNEGDMMYLPAMWYHKVSQSSGNENFSCSINYWFGMLPIPKLAVLTFFAGMTWTSAVSSGRVTASSASSRSTLQRGPRPMVAQAATLRAE